MIVTIDGPAGAGKSSIARRVASMLGFDFLDTGAIYRAITLAAIRADVDWADAEQLIAIAKKVEVEFRNDRIFLLGEDVSSLVRMPSVTTVVRHIADQPEIREMLTTKQRDFAFGRDVVTEGRDQGTEVFPMAECKIFLTASALERANRRYQQLAASGRHLPVEDVLAQQNQRDMEDQCRAIGRLRPADDAVVVHSDGMTTEQVIEKVLAIITERKSSLKVR